MNSRSQWVLNNVSRVWAVPMWEGRTFQRLGATRRAVNPFIVSMKTLKSSDLLNNGCKRQRNIQVWCTVNAVSISFGDVTPEGSSALSSVSREAHKADILSSCSQGRAPARCRCLSSPPPRNVSALQSFDNPTFYFILFYYFFSNVWARSKIASWTFSSLYF